MSSHAHNVPQGFGPWVRATIVVADVTLEVHCGGHNKITSTRGLHYDKFTP